MEIDAGRQARLMEFIPSYGSALNPINSSLIATGLLRNCDEPQQGSERGLLSDGWARHAPRVVGDAANGEVRDVRPWNGDSA